eukprot:TRINITY_DN92216_c0_g1_i1.p1 TRINITY_DN92216_c0_g1~~TRINITY_DN92216_c0_g1_i1.p1  ORF type:complete len:367 (-),score=42.23 TRINITY_DN92216_c0_g1_i1:24-1124(-)
MRAWSETQPQSPRNAGPPAQPSRPGRAAPPRNPLPQPPREPPYSALERADGSFIASLAEDVVFRWTKRPDGSWRKPERCRDAEAWEVEELALRLRDPSHSSGRRADPEDVAPASHPYFEDADNGAAPSEQPAATGRWRGGGGRGSRGYNTEGEVVVKTQGKLAGSQRGSEERNGHVQRRGRGGREGKAESSPSTASSSKAAAACSDKDDRTSALAVRVAERVERLMDLGCPDSEAKMQEDGSYVLTLEDGSTLRWTARPNGSWRKPEHKKKGWVGDLEQEKYCPPHERVKDGTGGFESYYGSGALGGGPGGGGALDAFDYGGRRGGSGFGSHSVLNAPRPQPRRDFQLASEDFPDLVTVGFGMSKR